MKLEVGMYVRIKNQADWCCIGKIVNINEFREPSMRYCVDIQGDDFIFVPEDMIVKASYSLVGNNKEDGVIEEGDYINGKEVLDADWYNDNGDYEEGLAFPMYASDDLDVIENWQPLKYTKIKTIVTKEQFESMSYKVGE